MHIDLTPTGVHEHDFQPKNMFKNISIYYAIHCEYLGFCGNIFNKTEILPLDRVMSGKTYLCYSFLQLGFGKGFRISI